MAEHRIVVIMYLISNGILQGTDENVSGESKHMYMSWSSPLHLLHVINCKVTVSSQLLFFLIRKKIMHFPVDFVFTGKSRFSGQQSVLNFSDQKLGQTIILQNTKRRSNS